MGEHMVLQLTMLGQRSMELSTVHLPAIPLKVSGTKTTAHKGSITSPVGFRQRAVCISSVCVWAVRDRCVPPGSAGLGGRGRTRDGTAPRGTPAPPGQHVSHQRQKKEGRCMADVDRPGALRFSQIQYGYCSVEQLGQMQSQ